MKALMSYSLTECRIALANSRRPQSAVVLSDMMIIEKDLDANAMSYFCVTLWGMLNAYDASKHMVSISS